MNKFRLINAIEKLQSEEFNKRYVDLTLICRYDSAIGDVSASKTWGDAVINLCRYHPRVFGKLIFNERD